MTVPRMAEFDNTSFDLDEHVEGTGMDDDFALPDVIMDPPAEVQAEVQDQVNMSVDRIQTLRYELRQTVLEDQKKRLVDTLFNEMSRAYGLRPEGRIALNSSALETTENTFYWTPGDR
ncbi:MAG: hypothetical protein AB2693_31695 [Candidatus Thiodiazotropha sp.]